MDNMVMDNNEHQLAPLGRLVIVAPSISVQIYLHTYCFTAAVCACVTSDGAQTRL